MTTPTPSEVQFLAQEGGYLALHGAKLVEQGYTVVPIQAGKKAPGFDGWQKSRPTKAQIDDWLKGGHKWSGVGILTKNVPAIDIDVRDEEVALKIEAWVREHIGDSPLRIGRAPKRLMMFRTDEPFRKLRSTKYKDDWGDEHQIEILGDGQQFVAYHKHPDTGKPYTWPNGDNPLNTRASDLPTLTVEQVEQLISYFDEIADELGWEVVKAARKASKAIDSDNPWVEDTAPVTIDDDELRNRLLLVPHPDDYDEWIKIGMALYHQFDGDETGLKLWHEWAETADNYDADALDRRWDGFKVDGKRRAPITARYILRLAQESVENTAAELALQLHDAFLAAKTLPEWEKARQQAREAEIDGLSRSGLAQVAKATRDQITGTKTSLVEIKKAISYLPKKLEKTPEWARPWVYDTSEDKFFCTERKIITSQQGFNAMFDRKALTKKDILDARTSPSSTASALALNMFKIPTVVGRRYMPGRDAIFVEPDGTFANTYPEHEIPEIPEKMTARDKRNIERVKTHIRHLLKAEDEQAMFLDWLSWVVQNPGKHANYGVLLQGVQGDGKTFFAEMMRAVMGVSNVTMLNAHIMHSDFTDWAEGQCLACFEEVRLVNDKNKYETVNRIKPFITNKVIEVHPKGKPPRNVLNTTNYLLFSNYKDAMPLDDTDRRYLVLFSRWQNREMLLAFMRENPDYYADLYATIEESAGALRKWLLNHEQADDFNAMGSAPDTAARRMMIYRAKPAFIQQLDELIAENMHAGLSHELLDLGTIHEVMFERSVEVPPAKTLSTMLERDGYEFVGRVRNHEGEVRRYYSKRVENFTSESGGLTYPDAEKVRQFLKARADEIDEL
jgi:hypothetical protein